MSDSGDGRAHILVFPYPAPGHVTPLLNFTQLLLTRGLKVTVLLTPSYGHLLDPLLSRYPPDSIRPLVLPVNDAPITSDFTFFAKMRGLRELHNPILLWFQSHNSPPIAIISDVFLGWTHHLACQLGIPRVAFYSSGVLHSLVSYHMWRDLPGKDGPRDDDFPVSFPAVPNCPKYSWWQLSFLFREYEVGDPDCEAYRDGIVASLLSWGLVFNSFTELESLYIHHAKKLAGHDRVWAVGPLLSPDGGLVGAEGGGSSQAPTADNLMSWPSPRAENSVVYVCFGSHFMLTDQQMHLLLAALEYSGVYFILVENRRIKGHVVAEYGKIPDGFEDRVEGKGFVIRGWAPQVAILRHPAVGVFVTHCGWNSTLEGLLAGVMMLTWPIDADQFTNAELLVEHLGVATRACEGGTRTLPDLAELARLLSESVTGTRPKRIRVRELQEAALKAAKGSSQSLDELVEQLGEFKSRRT